MSDTKEYRAGLVPDILAILPLRGTVLMPHAVLPLGAGRASSVRLIEEVVALSPGLPDELINVVGDTEAPGALGDLIAASLPTLANERKQELLETYNVRERLQKLAGLLAKEAEVLELGSKIQSEVQSEVSKSQREYYLREQLKAIQKELGESDERTQELETLRQKIEAAGMSEEARTEALRE